MNNRWIAVASILCSLGLLFFSPVAPAQVANGAIRRLTSAPGGVSKFEISPDGQWIAFLESDGMHTSLYSVPSMGGPITRLADSVPWSDPQTTAWRRVFAISPDSQRVLYFGRPEPTPTPTPDPGQPYVRYPGMGLYSVPIDGSAGSLVVADDPRVHTFAFSPDSQRAIFATGTGTDNTFGEPYRYELFSRALSGGQVQRLNIDLPAGQSVVFDKWSVLQTGYVIYAVGAPAYNYPYGPSYGSVDLYSVPVNGPAGSSLKLTTCSQVSMPTWTYTVAADGQRIVYSQIDCDGNGVLRSIDPAGASPVRLSPLATTQAPGDIAISSDGRFVVYTLTDLSVQPSSRDIYIAPVAGPSSGVHLVQTAAALGVNPVLVGLSRDGEWLAFTAPASDEFETPTPLYVASRTGGTNAPRLVTAAFPNGVYTTFSADSGYLIYQEVGGFFQSLEMTTGSMPVSLGVAAASYTGVYTNPHSDRLLIRNHSDGFLYSVLAAGPGSSFMRVSNDLVDYYGPVRFTPDGLHVVYIGFTDGQLYVTDIDEPYNEVTPICGAPPACGTPSVNPTHTVTVVTTSTRSPTATPTPYTVFLPDLRRAT